MHIFRMRTSSAMYKNSGEMREEWERGRDYNRSNNSWLPLEKYGE
jgi:hypothetical protein